MNGKHYAARPTLPFRVTFIVVTRYTDGKLEPHLKSEDVPESQGNVKVTVPKNFDELIFNSGKDALIGRLSSLFSPFAYQYCT